MQYWIVGVCGIAVLQCCTVGLLQCHSIVWCIVTVFDCAVLECYSSAVLECWSVTVLQCWEAVCAHLASSLWQADTARHLDGRGRQDICPLLFGKLSKQRYLFAAVWKNFSNKDICPLLFGKPSKQRYLSNAVWETFKTKIFSRCFPKLFIFFQIWPHPDHSLGQILILNSAPVFALD